MPTTIILRGGGKFTLKGDGPGAVIKRLFRPMATGIAMNGHIVEFRWRDRLFIDPEPEAEYQARVAAEAKKVEEQAKAQAEAQAKADNERAEALAKAAKEFVAEYGPNPGKGMR